MINTPWLRQPGWWDCASNPYEGWPTSTTSTATRSKVRLVAGRNPRRTFLVAHSGTNGRGLVDQRVSGRVPRSQTTTLVRVGYDLPLTTGKSLGRSL